MVSGQAALVSGQAALVSGHKLHWSVVTSCTGQLSQAALVSGQTTTIGRQTVSLCVALESVIQLSGVLVC